MDVKILMKVGLLGGSIIAGNIGSAFADWTCNANHMHECNRMCPTTGERFCERCDGVHLGREVCPCTVRSVGAFKWIEVPRNTPEGEIAAFQIRYEYDNDGKKIGNNYVLARNDVKEAKEFAGYTEGLADGLQEEMTEREAAQFNETCDAFFWKGSQQAKRKREGNPDRGKRNRQQGNERSRSVSVSEKSRSQSDEEEDAKSKGGDSPDLSIREDVITGKYEHGKKRLRKGGKKLTRKEAIEQDKWVYHSAGVPFE